MKEVYLKCDMIPYKKSSVNALIDRLYTITQSNYGVLSGNVIWFELLDRLGVHFDSVKCKLGFSISVEKKELDNAADMRMPIKNTIDIAINKVTE